MTNVRRFWVVVAACAGLALVGSQNASAQLSAHSGSTTGSTCAGTNNGSGFCGSSRQSLVTSGTNFQSRYAWNINADVGAFSTRDTSGTARHNVSFTATAPGTYRVTIATSRLGDMNRQSDIINCNGRADISGVTGTSNFALNSGSLNLADPGAIGNGTSSTSSPFSQSASATIDRLSNGVGQNHSLSFTWSGSVRSNSCEAAVRVGQQNGSTSGCGACGYAGTPARTQSSDGHFVNVTYQSFCGDGIIQGGFGEACDQGSANGTFTSCCNTNCTFKNSSNTCRSSAGPCDPAENCTGSNANCPADVLSPSTTVCRASGGVCDVAENCSGSSPGCPFDFKQGTLTTCRPSAGVCDPQENCDGVNNACPANALSPSTTVCRASAGICDMAENCTGGSPTCPANVFQPSSTVCRGAAGVCDAVENCTGSGAACPADAKLNTVCRAAAGVCDLVESCDGVSNNCPADSVSGAFVTCRPAADVCDAVENCDGANVDCPADGYLPSTTVCRGSGGVCDVVENCTGGGVACPADGFLPSTTVCRPDAGQCDVADNCTGSSATCPPDAFEADGFPCDDGDLCTDPDTCDGAGACESGGDVNDTCAPCEACDPGTGNCIAGPRTDCFEPTVAAKSRVLIKDKDPDRGDLFVWKWIKGEATTLADFGDPTTANDYTVCVFDAGTEVFRASIPAGGACGSLPCWRLLGSSGYKYIDRDRTPDGILKVLLKSGAAGKAKIILKGKGDNLPLPAGFLPMATPVQIQLSNDDPGQCWQTTHTSLGPLINALDQFKSVSDGPTP